VSQLWVLTESVYARSIDDGVENSPGGSKRELSEVEKRGPSPIALTYEWKTINLRTRIAAGATAAAMVSIFGLAGTTASAAPSAPPSTVAAAQAAVDLPVTGTPPDGSTFTGQLSQLAVSAVNGVPMLSGVLTGTGLPAAGVPFTTAITGATAACQVLNLNIQSLNLDLLGLVVNLDAVHLAANAVPGAGNLLGNLLCALANAANPAGRSSPGR
jgi:hypothetical protein